MFKNKGLISQALLIAIVFACTVVAVTALLVFGKKSSSTSDAHVDASEEVAAEDEHNEAIAVETKKLAEYGIQLAQVERGAILQSIRLPAKLTANLDKQAHVTATFSGRVDAVYVDLEQVVKKGQALAQIVSPELVEQQSNLRLAETNLQQKQQEYRQEKDIWQEGATAKRDYQRAEHAYQQAQIAVKEAKARILALGAKLDSNGRYTITAPLSGVISRKDIVVGEHVQVTDALLVIDEPNQLWLELNLPTQQAMSFKPGQNIDFYVLGHTQTFQARLQHISSQADAETGRLQMRALVQSNADVLRPNTLLNVELAIAPKENQLRIAKAALQSIENQTVVFIAKQNEDKVEFYPQKVRVAATSDPQWVIVEDGLQQGQRYVTQGSFLLKSELEKGEAAHDH